MRSAPVKWPISRRMNAASASTSNVWIGATSLRAGIGVAAHFTSP
jgi:hypothetical protein